MSLIRFGVTFHTRLRLSPHTDTQSLHTSLSPTTILHTSPPPPSLHTSLSLETPPPPPHPHTQLSPSLSLKPPLPHQAVQRTSAQSNPEANDVLVLYGCARVCVSERPCVHTGVKPCSKKRRPAFILRVQKVLPLLTATTWCNKPSLATLLGTPYIRAHTRTRVFMRLSTHAVMQVRLMSSKQG